ncbi:MAG: PAS domain S-box protein [Pseudomonadota bacterium]
MQPTESEVYANIVESSSEAITALDLEFRILAINKANLDAFERAFGKRPRVGEPFLSLFDDAPQHVAQQREIWTRALNGEAYVVVQEFGDTRLERRYYEVRFSPLFNKSGERIGASSTSYDVTDRVRAEQQLAETREQFRLLVQGVTDYALYMLDADGNVTSWNAGAERIKGYRAEEIIGQHFSRFYSAEDQNAGVPATGLDTARRDGRWEVEGWRVRKDGTRFWAHVIIDAIHDDAGQFVGFAKITRDVTERMESERQLDEARQALFQSQKMEAVGQLTGGVAHDFNNLLTVIIGGLDRIARNKPSAQASRALDMARTAADRAAGLTARLLAFSRKQTLQPTPLDLNAVVRDMTELLHRTLGEDVELEGVLSPRLWRVELDRNQLESAVLNLAVNARDAMPSGGKLTLETANTYLDANYATKDVEVVPGQYVMISVTDTGSGIPNDLLQKVFEPFFTTKEPGRGTGLGLSMVYGFVKQSGGHAMVYSEEGQGTCVKLYFPRYYGDDLAIETPQAASSPSARGGEVVLVVEDNPDVRIYSVTSLKELGYEVLESVDAEAALRLLASDRRIDLLFTDVVLPGKTGRQLADEARAMRPALKVLFTTGYSRNAIVHQGRLDPGVELLPKPFTFEELAARIHTVINA